MRVKIKNLKFKIKNYAGFTLVELLIVIGLLGAIALIVIAAINPIEQSNRARDTRFKADGAQLISAHDRFFAARNEFVWVTVSKAAGGSVTNDDAFGFLTAGNEGVGLCGATCTTDGYLITTDELKPEFRNRDFIKATALDKQLLIGKAQGTSESVYACFIPASKATRDKSVADQHVYTISAADGTRAPTTTCDAAGANWVTSGCYVCIPE